MGSGNVEMGLSVLGDSKKRIAVSIQKNQLPFEREYVWKHAAAAVGRDFV